MNTADRARFAAVRDAARAAITRGTGGRWELPGGGLLHFERPLPFLVVARAKLDDASAALSGGIASRLLWPTELEHEAGFTSIASAIVSALAERFSAVCSIHVRMRSAKESPGVDVALAERARWDPLEPVLREAFSDLAPAARFVRLLADASAVRGELGERVCALEISLPASFEGEGAIYPHVLDDLHRSLFTSLARVLDTFVARFVDLPRGVPSPHLGTSVLDAHAQRADRVLADAARSFDVLLQLTPVNLRGIWQRLVKTDFREEPRLEYRPLPFDPMVLKRRIFEAQIEKVEDPFVAVLLRDKQEELDRLLSMLRSRGETFLHESEQLFGRPSKKLLELAQQILRTAESSSDLDHTMLGMPEIVERTRAHLLRYRDQDPLFPEEIEIDDRIAAGLMVSRGRLIVRPDLVLSERRLFALLEHEVGTHVVTWFNGTAQPLTILGAGLAGYESLQEGIAVLAEHLLGMLDRARLRVIAARVVAADHAANGASFLEVFSAIRELGIDPRGAFQTAVRALRGGGMTKDLVYLRGIVQAVRYVAEGGDLARLFAGKIALSHIDVIEELEARGIVAPPRVLPLFLRDRGAQRRIAEIRAAGDPVGLVLGLEGESRAA